MVDKEKSIYRNLKEEINFPGSLGYVPIKPEERIAEISKIENRETKKEELDKFKKEFFEQKIKIADLIVKLQDFIFKNPDLGPEIYKEKVQLKCKELKLNEEQINYFNEVIDKFCFQRKIIKNYKDQKISGEELFKKYCGKKPKSRVNVDFAPMEIVLKPVNTKDFLYFLSDEEDINNAEKIKNVGAVFAPIEIDGKFVNTIIVNPNYFEDLKNDVLIHENEHVFQSFFNKDSIAEEKILSKEKQLRKYVKRGEKEKAEKNFLEYLSDYPIKYEINILAREILASYKEDFNLSEIRELIENYLSIIFKKNEALFNRWLKGIGANFLKENGKNFFRENIIQGINEMIEAIKILQENNFNRDEIIALLITEPPQKWLKWAYRLSGKNKKNN